MNPTQDRRELLRFLTAGSVDDGKSTLIGRLLHDINGIYQDQLAAVRTASASTAHVIDFSLVTDGLRAEREQGITIDVAYRYFATPRRKFIVADSPGHEQYTRNMATGASTASLAVLLVDARKGVLPQTHRHAIIASLMGIGSFAVVVNKMDLVDYSEDVFRAIERDFTDFMDRLGRPALQFIPCCAPQGHNIASRSDTTPWYEGPSLLEFLETTPVSHGQGGPHLRFPVQSVIRSGAGDRHYTGQVAAGGVRPGDNVLALPSGRTARVHSVRLGDDEIDRAVPPLSVAIQLDRELDIGRGDMLVDPQFPPMVTSRFSATLLWMSTTPLGMGRPYLVKHTSRYVCGSVVRLNGVIDPVSLERHEAGTLALNQFAEVEIETHHPIYADCYGVNHAGGAFIVVEPISNETVAAGMIRADLRGRVEPGPRLSSRGTQGMTLWFTGLSSAGKSTISKAVYEKLWAKGYRVELLDGDVIRQHMSKDLGFSKEDRDENIRRIGFTAELLTRNGVIVLVAAISPYRQVREEVRARIGNFVEVFVNAPLPVVEKRDLKGIYRRCRAGEITGVTGLDDPYEPPANPEVECRTDQETLAESVERVIQAVEARMAGNTP
jgi:bifunctional enzyme CysN/CysC